MSETSVLPIAMRKATPADKEAVALLCRAIDPDDYVPNMFDDAVSHEGPGGLYVAEQAGRIVGCHGLDWREPDNAFLYAMRIHPDLQGRGIGTEYCRLQIEQAARVGVRHLFLSSAVKNVRAHRIVEKNGFVNLGQWIIYEERPVPAIPAEPGRARAGRPEDLPRVAAFQERLAGQVMAGVMPAEDYPYGFGLMRDEDWAVENLVVVDGADGLEGVMLLATCWGDQLYIRRLEGTPAAASDLLGYAAAWGQARGLTQWCVSLPARCEQLIAPLGFKEEDCWRWFMFYYQVR